MGEIAMTLEAIKEDRKNLEQAIRRSINQFKDKTGVRIRSLSIHTIEYYCPSSTEPQQAIERVELEIEL